MKSLLLKYLHKEVNLSTRCGHALYGVLSGITTQDGVNIVIMSDRWSSKRYILLDEIAHFWCPEDKPEEQQS